MLAQAIWPLTLILGYAMLVGAACIFVYGWLAWHRRRERGGVEGRYGCGRCGYVMAFGMPVVCSECGADVRRTGLRGPGIPGVPLVWPWMAMGAVLLLPVAGLLSFVAVDGETFAWAEWRPGPAQWAVFAAGWMGMMGILRVALRGWRMACEAEMRVASREAMGRLKLMENPGALRGERVRASW